MLYITCFCGPTASISATARAFSGLGPWSCNNLAAKSFGTAQHVRWQLASTAFQYPNISKHIQITTSYTCFKGIRDDHLWSLILPKEIAWHGRQRLTAIQQLPGVSRDNHGLDAQQGPKPKYWVDLTGLYPGYTWIYLGLLATYWILMILAGDLWPLHFPESDQPVSC